MSNRNHAVAGSYAAHQASAMCSGGHSVTSSGRKPMRFHQGSRFGLFVARWRPAALRPEEAVVCKAERLCWAIVIAAPPRKEKKFLFTFLNYRLNLGFHLKLENQVFFFLELAKPDIWSPWMIFLSGFHFFLLYLFWINL